MEKLKPYLIIFITLLIGFIMGILTQRMLIRHQINNITEVQLQKEFKSRFLGGLSLTPEQQAELDPILDEHSERTKNLRMAFRSTIDSLFQDLEIILTEEQMKTLKERRQRRRRGKGQRPFPPRPRE
ncbi:MAG: hypothetical protein AAF824_18780 [Bacteroidota bacterium]